MITIETFASENGICCERARQLFKAGKVTGVRKIGEGRRGVWEIQDNATILRTGGGRPKLIDATQFPQLLTVMWDRKGKKVDARTAFGLYERNAKWIDPGVMDKAERALFDKLIMKYGQGVFNA